VEDERRHVELLEVFSEIGLRDFLRKLFHATANVRLTKNKEHAGKPSTGKEKHSKSLHGSWKRDGLNMIFGEGLAQ